VPDGKRDHHVLRTRTRKASDSHVSRQSRASDAMTAFSGSMPFVYLHAIWFGAWLLCNEGVSDYENDIRAETWSIHLGRKLGVDQSSVEADIQQRLRDIPK
jgi:hypothetical protein